MLTTLLLYIFKDDIKVINTILIILIVFLIYTLLNLNKDKKKEIAKAII